ncbi:MAG: mechanosensitive ion channel domain-containing protein [Pseudomonadota bacterium]
MRLIPLLFLALFAFALPGEAQVPLPTGGGGDDAAPTALPDPLTPEAVREMVARLSDAEVRALLLDRLDAVASAAVEEAAADERGLSEFLELATLGAADQVAIAVRRIPMLLSLQVQSFVNFWEKVGSTGFWIIVVVLGSAIVFALAVEALLVRLTRSFLERAASSGQAESLGGRVRFLFFRFLQDLMGVIVFFFAAQWAGINVALALFGGAPELALIGPYAQLIWVYLIVLPRLGAAFSRFMLAPKRPEFRLVYTDDASARFLHRNQIGLFVLIGFSIAIIQFNALNGIQMGEIRIGFWLNLAVHIYIGWIAWQGREGLRMMMRGADPDVSPTEARLARAYPWFAIGVSVATWWLVNIIVAYGDFALLNGAPHYWTMAILLMAPALDTLIRGLVRHLVPPMTGDGEVAERAYLSTKRSYIRIGRVLVFAAAVLAVAEVWGIDFRNLAAAGVGAQVAGGLIEVVFFIAAAYLVWELVSLWINRRLAREHSAAAINLEDEEPGGGEGGGVGGSRLSTVLPLLLGVAKGAIAVIFTLLALGHVGIDITPLLAGAGIIGLAIGFGAQKLVADIVSGIFFLVDDAFRTGEYIEIAGTVGTVEKISIRSMQLRHHRGPVHTIPYGEIPQITNYSRDWVIMKLKFTVPFDTDLGKVKKIFKQIGKDMMEVPEFAADFLQPFKSQGVLDVDDVGIVVRGKFMAKPGKQFTLRKEVYQRVQKAFDENGIQFARKEVRVKVDSPSSGDLSEENRQAVGAAAAEAAAPPPGSQPA